jgi:hypothetical protein
LDEVVGTFSSSGNNLSGGQWQKVALTRCVYRDDTRGQAQNLCKHRTGEENRVKIKKGGSGISGAALSTI